MHIYQLFDFSSAVSKQTHFLHDVLMYKIMQRIQLFFSLFLNTCLFNMDSECLHFTKMLVTDVLDPETGSFYMMRQKYSHSNFPCVHKS